METDSDENKYADPSSVEFRLWMAQQKRKKRKLITLAEQVLSILNRYNATMILPGVSGVMRFGYQPGNYRESTGQTLAAADQQVGLVVDAARVPGVFQAVTLGAGWTAQTGAAISGSTIVMSNTTAGFGAYRPSSSAILVTGKVYEAEINISSISAGSVSVWLGGFQTQTTNESRSSAGTLRVRLIPTASWNGNIVVGAVSNATSAVVTSFSVRELPGIHASQSTSGFQPVLRNTSGIQSWQFDGTDDRLSLSAVPFQMSDDHFVVAGGNVTSLGAVTTLATPASKIGSNTRVPQLRVEADGKVRSFWIDDAGAQAPLTSAGVLVVAGQPFVATARKSGTTGVVRFNGTQQVSSSLSALGATACDRGEIGAWAGIDRMNGHIHGVIFGKGAISDSELLTLERFMAQLQGRQL